MKKVISKTIRIFLIVVASIVLLNIMLFILLSIPTVQKKATDFALSKLKPKLNTELSIESINIQLLNRVQLGGIYIEDLQKDTLLYAKKLDVKFNPFGLLKNKLQFYSIQINDFNANVYKEKADSTFNFQFVIDAFASEDPKPKDPNKKPMVINFDRVRLKNGHAHYHIKSFDETSKVFNSNHIDVYDLNADIKAPSIDIDNLDVTINSLSFKEHSGIDLKNLSAKVKSKDSRIESEKLIVKLNSSELKANDIVYDLDSKEFSIKVKTDNLQTSDVAIFSPQLAHLQKTVVLDADIEGQLPATVINKLVFEYGKDTKADLKGTISDFTKYADADILIDVKELRSTQSDIDSFMKIGSSTATLPDQVKALGDINLKLLAKGSFKKVDIDAQVRTNPGSVKISGFGSIDTTFTNYAFDGRLTTSNLNTAIILGDEVGLDMISANIDAKVNQRANAPLLVEARGNISSMVYNDFNFRDINFDGTYNNNDIEASINTNTEDNKFDIHAHMLSSAGMDITLQAVIDKLTLEPFYTQDGWKDATLTTRIDGSFKGSSIDDLIGTMVIDSTSLIEESFIYNPGPIFIEANIENNNKEITLYSSVLEAEIKGDYYFSTLGQELKQILEPHLPTLLSNDATQKHIENNKNHFTFLIELKNTEDLSYALSLPFYNVETGTVTGDIDLTNQRADIAIMVPRLMFGNNDIRQTKGNIAIQESTGVDVNIATYLVQDDGYINGDLKTHVVSDSIVNKLFFDMNNNLIKTTGELSASVGFDRDEEDKDLITYVDLHPTTILFNKKEVHIMRGSITNSKDHIEIRDFGIMHSGNQQFGIDGIASKHEDDSVRIFFDKAELANILTAFNVQNIKGTIDGDIIVRQALQDPVVQTQNFNISNIRTDKDTIGTLHVESIYNPAEDGLTLDVFIQNQNKRYMSVNGFVPTSDKKELDIDMNIDKFPLRWLQPFTVATLSNLEGTMSSEIGVNGKTSEPIIEGWLGVNDGVLKVDYTNVEYRISDTIRVNKDNLGFRELVITDDNDNTAKIGLILRHTNFGRFEYRTRIVLDDFMLLNNPDRSDLMAHGVLKLDGEINVNGSPSGIFGTANISNGSKSKVKIELPQTASATEYKGIIYINTPNETDSLSFLRKDNGNNTVLNRGTNNMLIDMQATVNLDPDLDLTVQYNPRTGDAVSISGTSELNVNFNSKSDPQVRIYGEYIAEDGEASHNLQGLKKINFKLKEGSKLNFTGDPLRTQFNLTAYHQVKADLSTLSESFSHDTNLSNTRVPVNALLEIRGDLDAMELYYDIELPEASQDVQRKVESLINTEEARIRQFAYLVTTNSFYGASSSPDLALGNDMFTNLAANALSKGLDALFASALNENWSISTNLKSQNGSFDDVRMGVDVSTRLFDDRLRLSTNLSYGDAQLYDDQQSFIGEFELEYDLTNWLMLRAFNKANERYYKLAPTTQGAGVMINKESKKFRDLFKFRFFQRKKKEGVTKSRKR